MTSVLCYIKRGYSDRTTQTPHEHFEGWKIFQEDCLQRIGKQYLSISISTSMLKARVQRSNRQVSLALKKFQDDLAVKMRIDNKRQLYRLFGRYTFEQLQNFKDASLLELELAQIFFKRLQYYSTLGDCMPKFKPLPSLNPSTIAGSDSTSASSHSKGEFGQRSQGWTVVKTGPLFERLHTILQEVHKINPKNNYNQIKAQKSKQIQNDSDKSQNNDDQVDNFNFQLTEKDVDTEKKDYCEEYFINLVSYLKNLSSPQGELTYIWQHLKWQGFETSYEPCLNQKNQWVCTARIYFPATMVTAQINFLERTQTSKNKRKARQLACMDLLKSLYLEYPEVWMVYRHLKQEKKLVIAPLDEPKDDDELAIITNRSNYRISKDKIEKVFKHNKTDIRNMMEQISAKAELNTLLQQLPGRVTSPKLQKKPFEGFWSVPVRIEYRTEDHIENRIPPKVYEKTVIFHNAKMAEQEAYMQAIIELYQENAELFEKIQSIKIAKNIKDAEKKLPLLRNYKTEDIQSQTTVTRKNVLTY